MSANRAHRFSSRLLPVRTGCAQELRVTPEDPVFTHTRGGPIELNPLLPQRDRRQHHVAPPLRCRVAPCADPRAPASGTRNAHPNGRDDP